MLSEAALGFVLSRRNINSNGSVKSFMSKGIDDEYTHCDERSEEAISNHRDCRAS